MDVKALNPYAHVIFLFPPFLNNFQNITKILGLGCPHEVLSVDWLGKKAFLMHASWMHLNAVDESGVEHVCSLFMAIITTCWTDVIREPWSNHEDGENSHHSS